MNNPQTILLAVNFTQHSRHAALSAAEIAKRTGARLVIVHGLAEVSESLMPRGQVLNFAKRWLSDCVEEVTSAGAKVSEYIIEPGRPAGVILRTAEAVDANLLVMATHSAPDPEPRSLGLVAGRVLRSSRTPVLLVPPNSSSGVRKILCAYNPCEAAEHALTGAATMAVAFEAQLHVLRVFRRPDIEEILGYYPGEATLREADLPAESDIAAQVAKEEEALRQRVERLEAPGLRTTHEVLVGRPYREIARAATKDRYDMIFLGAVGRGLRSKAPLGPVARKVSSMPPCSAVFFRKRGLGTSQIEERVEKLLGRFQRARQFLRERNFQMAIKDLRWCRKRAPHFAPVIEGLSRARLECGRKAEAEALAKEAELIREKLSGL